MRHRAPIKKRGSLHARIYFVNRAVHGIHKRGFTLIELLVVIAIVGLLSSVILAALNSARSKSRDARRQEDLVQMRTALELYANAHNGSYPASTSWDCQDCTGSYGDSTFFINNFVTPGYISQWPNDPTPLGSRGSTNYGYLYYSDGVDYKLLIFSTVENACQPKSLMRGNGQQNAYIVCSRSSYSTDCQGNAGYTTTCP